MGKSLFHLSAKEKEKTFFGSISCPEKRQEPPARIHMSPRIYFATNTHLPVPSFRFSGRRLFLDENDKPLLSQNKTDFSLLNKKCKCSARRKCLLRFEGTLLEFTPNLKQRMFPKYTATRVKNKGGGTKKHAQYDVKFILSRQKKGNRFFTIFF